MDFRKAERELASKRGIHRAFERRVAGRVKNLLSVAEEYRQTAAALGFPEAQTATVVNGMDLNRVRPVPAERQTDYDFLTFGWDFHRKGGDLILSEAKRVLTDEYPECCDKLVPALPDEKSRRVGQSVAAASLPELS